jgi:hypothetical protein
MAAQTAAIGFSVHSGWAAMVVLGRGAVGAAALSVLARARIELIDAGDKDSKQPYHAVEFLSVEQAAARLQNYLDVATAMAGTAISMQCEALEQRGYRISSVGILDSAGRKTGSLSTILASHALIHAADGDHFRNALSAAAESHGLEVHRLQARVLEEHAAKQLRVPAKRVLDTVNDLGRQVGAPWGADQKKAALLAWTLLAGPTFGPRKL